MVDMFWTRKQSQIFLIVSILVWLGGLASNRKASAYPQEQDKELVSSNSLELTLDRNGLAEVDLGEVRCSATKKVQFILRGPLKFQQIKKSCKCRKLEISPRSIGRGEFAVGEFVFRAPRQWKKNKLEFRFVLVDENGNQQAVLLFKYRLSGNLSLGEKSIRLDILERSDEAEHVHQIPVTLSKPILAENLTCAVDGVSFLNATIQNDVKSNQVMLVLRAGPPEKTLLDSRYMRAQVTVFDRNTKASSDLMVVMRIVPAVRVHPTSLKLKENSENNSLECRFLLNTDLGYADGDEVVRCSVEGERVEAVIRKSSGNLKWIAISIPKHLDHGDQLRIEVKHPESTTIVSAKLLSLNR